MRRSTEEIEKLLSRHEDVIKECSERTLAKLLDYSPRNYESCLELADAYLILSEWEPCETVDFYYRAFEASQRAAEINPEGLSAGTWDFLGLNFGLSGQHHNAIKSYKRAALLEPENGMHHIHLACEYEMVEDYRNAIKSYRRGLSKPIQIDEYRPAARNNLARLCKRNRSACRADS